MTRTQALPPRREGCKLKTGTASGENETEEQNDVFHFRVRTVTKGKSSEDDRIIYGLESEARTRRR
jgi:hypothetical protein